MSIVWAMSGKFFKNHKTPNIRFRATPVYTNTPIAGAMRGFGSPQEFFAQQCQLNRIAKDLGMDIIQLQLKNLVEPDGFDQRNGQRHGNARPIDCVKKGMELFGWEEAVKEQEESGAAKGRFGHCPRNRHWALSARAARPHTSAAASGRARHRR